ncbi:MAG: ABC transporter, partial [Gemmatimonadota bacterium]
LVADGPVEELVTRAKDGAHITVEAAGADVAERLGTLPGVVRIEPHDAGGGRVRASLTVSGAVDLRPRIFELAKVEGWTLYELHEEAGSLEDLFHELTTGEAA